MKKVLIVIMLLFSPNVFASVAVEGQEYYMSDMTRLNLRPGDFKTHVLLCRLGNSRALNRAEECRAKCRNDNGCGCDFCTSGSDKIGLGLAFITADTKGQNITEYLKVDANTDNILWSAFCRFTMHSPDDNRVSSCIDTCCKPIEPCRVKPGKFKFEYYYNNNYGKLNETTLREGFEATTAGPRIKDNNSYPHNAEGCDVLEFPQKFRENNIHHLKRVLRNAVYGWTIDYKTIPEVLQIIGRVCENTENKRVVPKFNLAGVWGYNCAKFCARVLDEFGFFSYQPPVDDRSIMRRFAMPAFDFIGGACGMVAAMLSGPVGLIGYSFVAGVDISFGLIIGKKEIEKLKEEAVIPNDILYEILELYKRYQRDYGPIPLSNFFVFAHDQEEREASRTREAARENEVQMDYYNQFTLKSISDIIRHDVSVDKKHTEVFYTTLF